MYELLAIADWRAKTFTSRLRSVDSDPVEEARDARAALAHLYFHLDRNKIFFPSELCKLVDEFIVTLDDELGELNLLIEDDAKTEREPFSNTDTREALAKASAFVQKKVPEMRKELEGEFRALLSGS